MEEMKDDPLNLLESLVVRYKNHNLIRILVQLIPFGIGSAIDVGLITRIQSIREERAREFFDELSTGDVELSENLVESEDFLHCYFSTATAALNTRRREKIKLFARLLKSSVKPGNFVDTDEFEEYLGILDDLSYREIEFLAMLDTIQNDIGQMNEEELDGKLEETAGRKMEDVIPSLARLSRTGLVEHYPPAALLDETASHGKLTSRYFKLKGFIGAAD